MKFLIPIILIPFISCSNFREQNKKQSKGFEFPHIIQYEQYDSIENWDTGRINEISPKFIGQYQFSDTIKLDDKIQSRKIDEIQYQWENRVFGSDIDTLSTDGLQIYTDYNTTLKAKIYNGAKKCNTFFPIYIVNETKSPKLFIGKNNYAFAIQEAIDTSYYNNWYAIEAEAFDFCGNGYFRRKLLPKEFIMLLMPKYFGTDTTYIRTRIKIGESIIVSKPYKGAIHKAQFTIPNDDWLAKRIKETSYKWMFYGGRSKEF